MKAQVRIKFCSWSFFLLVGKNTLLIFVGHGNTFVSTKVGIASAFNSHPQRIASSWLLPSPESLTRALEEMAIFERRMERLREN